MSLATRLNRTATVSTSADGSAHGRHCYDEDTLVCGWPQEHTERIETYANHDSSSRLLGFDVEPTHEPPTYDIRAVWR